MPNKTDLSFLEQEISEQTAQQVAGFDKPEAKGLPILTIVNHNSDVLDEDSESYLEEAKAGDFLIKQTLQVHKTLLVSPAAMKYCYSEFQPDMGPFVGYRTSEEAKALAVDSMRFGSWETRDGNVLNETFLFVFAIHSESKNEQPEFALFPMMSSRIPIAKSLLRQIQTRRLPSGSLALPQMTTWAMTTKRQKNEKGSWFSPVFKHAGFVNNNQYVAVKALRNEIINADLLQIATPDVTEGDEDAF